jgi:hypothetical protein
MHVNNYMLETSATVLAGSTFDPQTTGQSTGRVLLPLGDVNAGEFVLPFLHLSNSMTETPILHSYFMSISPNTSGIQSIMVIDNEGEQFVE